MAPTKTPPPDVPGKTEEREKSKRIGALGALAPFVWPYRGLMFAALAALVATAVISLTLPLAVRRVVDNFDTENAYILDQYFAAALGIALLLAIGTRLPYALVSRLARSAIGADERGERSEFVRLVALAEDLRS